MTDVRSTLQDVFRRVFHDPDLTLRDELTASDVEGWDSLAHLNLIIAAEKAFKIKFQTAEISKLKDKGQNVGKLVAVIESKLAKAG